MLGRSSLREFICKKRFFFLKNFCLFLIGGSLLYNIVSVSTIYQHESATGIRMSSLS